MQPWLPHVRSDLGGKTWEEDQTERLILLAHSDVEARPSRLRHVKYEDHNPRRAKGRLPTSRLRHRGGSSPSSARSLEGGLRCWLGASVAVTGVLGIGHHASSKVCP